MALEDLEGFPLLQLVAPCVLAACASDITWFRTQVTVYKNQSLFFRGKRIREAIAKDSTDRRCMVNENGYYMSMISD